MAFTTDPGALIADEWEGLENVKNTVFQIDRLHSCSAGARIPNDFLLLLPFSVGHYAVDGIECIQEGLIFR